MEPFVKIINGEKPSTIVAKSFILSDWLGSEHSSEIALLNKS